MLRITLTIVPRGDESKAHVIGEVEVENVTTGRADGDDYRVRVTRNECGVQAPIHFSIQGHRRSLGAWVLASRILARIVAP